MQTIGYSGPIYQPIAPFVKISGLSRDFILKELKAGKIQHIRCGKKYMIDVPAYLHRLREVGD